MKNLPGAKALRLLQIELIAESGNLNGPAEELNSFPLHFCLFAAYCFAHLQSSF
jgi:hypothetical protein